MSLTLEQAILEVRRRSDMEHSQFVTDAEIKSYIQMSYTELYDLIVSRFEDYYITDTLFSLTEEDNTYTIPSNLYKIRGVDLITGAGPDDFVSLSKWNFQERGLASSLPVRVTGYRTVQYRLLGQEMTMMPANNAPGSYRLWYIPACPTLAAPSDEIKGIS